MDSAQVAAGMLAAVPFARTLGLEFESAAAGEAVVRLPDAPEVHNHVGGPHAVRAEIAYGPAVPALIMDRRAIAVSGMSRVCP